MASSTSHPEPALRVKWRLVCAYWVIQAVFLYAVVAAAMGCDSVDDWLKALFDRYYVVQMGTLLCAITVLQAVLLAPVARPDDKSAPARRRYVLLGALGVGALSGFPVLSLVLILELLDIGRFVISAPLSNRLDYPAAYYALGAIVGFLAGLIWLRRRCRTGMPPTLRLFVLSLAARALFLAVAFTLLAAVTLAIGKGSPSQRLFGAVIAVGLGLGWFVGTPLFIAFARRRDHDTVVGRLAGLLFVGTAVEAIATIPLDVIVRKKTDCYCAEGTLWALMVCQAAGALVLGPAIFLYPLARRRKRWLEGRCPNCGYDVAAVPNTDRCPECGLGWAPGNVTRAAM